MGAASCTHPLDLVKVHLQTQQEARLGMLEMGVRVVKNEGLLGLYAGLSASLLRQATYSTTRFAIYETGEKAGKTEYTALLPYCCHIRHICYQHFGGAWRYFLPNHGLLHDIHADETERKRRNLTKLPTNRIH